MRFALFTAAISALALSACSAATPAQSAEPRMAATPAENPGDPFATYTPWDSDNAAVKKAERGIEYVVLAAGPECESGPVGSDLAYVHYEGRLTTGEVFDSSLVRGEGISFPANGVIPGWTRTLADMCPGDDFLVYIPSEMAYGERPRPGGIIKPGDDLIFRIILLETVSNPPRTIAPDDWNGKNFQ